MPAESFTNQARLLVRALPVIAEEKTFALKCGTGINLFPETCRGCRWTSISYTCISSRER